MINNSTPSTTPGGGSCRNNEDVPQVTSHSNSQETPNTVTPYVEVTKKVPTITFPKKEQAVIMPVNESLKLEDYVKAIAQLTGPKSVIFASRIANGRICIYMTNTQFVDSLVSHKTIQVGQYDIQIRRMITPSKRVIISNVCPSIPHTIIEETLKTFGIKTVSPITFLRASIPGEEFNHVMSFRRQVYIYPPEDDNVQLPSSLIVSFEGTQYRIFLSGESMECFLCKQIGHIANNCPNTTHQQTYPQSHTQTITDQQSQNESAITQNQPHTTETSTVEPGIKRPHSPTLSTVSSNNANKTSETEHLELMPPPTQDITKNTKASHKNKKHKPTHSLESPNLENIIETIDRLYKQDSSPFPIAPTDFKAFLENTYGNNDPLMEARRFTEDINALLQFMSDIYNHLPDKPSKSRITRLSKKIRKQLTNDPSETASDSSASTQLSIDEASLMQDTDPNQSSQEFY